MRSGPMIDFFGEEEETHPVIHDEEIEYSEDKGSILGKGNFGLGVCMSAVSLFLIFFAGIVYKGTCRGAKVAIKIPSNDLTEAQIEEFRKELLLMSQIVHPCIVRFLGAYLPKDLQKEKVKLVMEISGKNLEDVMLDKGVEVSLFERVKWLKQIAEGMAWIHGAGIVHRDLKPSNCLLDRQSGVAKVCDFGLSFMLPKGDEMVIQAKGTPLYVAPELVSKGPTTHKCDVFSFGIMMYVFVARELPYNNRENLPSDLGRFLGLIVKGMRPWEKDTKDPRLAFPPEHECPNSLKELMIRCWAGDRNVRPPFQEIIDRMDPILVDCAIPSSFNGRKLWKRHFCVGGVQEVVPWNAFYEKLWDEFVPKRCAVEDQKIWFKVMKQMFCDDRDGKNEKVRLQKFGRILAYLPEMRKGKDWFDTVTNFCRQDWFFGEFTSQEAYKHLVSESPRAYLIRFSNVIPYFTVSFKEPGGAILHRRIVKHWGEEAVSFEKADICPEAKDTFKTLPHLVDTISRVMKWHAVKKGGPFSWIFSSGDAVVDSGYYTHASHAFIESEDDEEEKSKPVEFSRKETLKVLSKLDMQRLKKEDLQPTKEIRYLGRSGVITEVTDGKVQILFRDIKRKEWILEKDLLQKGFQNE